MSSTIETRRTYRRLFIVLDRKLGRYMTAKKYLSLPENVRNLLGDYRLTQIEFDASTTEFSAAHYGERAVRFGRSAIAEIKKNEMSK